MKDRRYKKRDPIDNRQNDITFKLKFFAVILIILAVGKMIKDYLL